MCIRDSPYLPGEHYASEVGQMIQMIEYIRFMHNKHTTCHGDIRASNLVFGPVVSKPIDYEYSGTTNRKQYPQGFNLFPGDGSRHADVAPGVPLQEVHDWFALGAVMAFHSCPNDQPSWEAATAFVKVRKIDEALNLLENLAQHTLTIQSELEMMLKATGSPPRTNPRKRRRPENEQ
eukprot:TRINITY_DN2172_c0_g1_i1.p1 TRINITY_DN2172_c0_g1~~TRINITY_DN2172_c0_g1_i1.p1  ORF type:complete len:177 (+),score=20.34 TRINITY_DN2172_c0_g1_i1:148-678(+)